MLWLSNFSWGQEAKVKNGKEPGPLPVSVNEAIEAIATTGKGRCWYCDSRLPPAERAISEGWDVQRIAQEPVASIIVVCPACLGRSHEGVGTVVVRRHRSGARAAMASNQNALSDV